MDRIFDRGPMPRVKRSRQGNHRGACETVGGERLDEERQVLARVAGADVEHVGAVELILSLQCGFLLRLRVRLERRRVDAEEGDVDVGLRYTKKAVEIVPRRLADDDDPARAVVADKLLRQAAESGEVRPAPGVELDEEQGDEVVAGHDPRASGEDWHADRFGEVNQARRRAPQLEPPPRTNSRALYAAPSHTATPSAASSSGARTGTPLRHSTSAAIDNPYRSSSERAASARARLTM